MLLRVLPATTAGNFAKLARSASTSRKLAEPELHDTFTVRSNCSATADEILKPKLPVGVQHMVATAAAINQSTVGRESGS